MFLRTRPASGLSVVRRRLASFLRAPAGILLAVAAPPLLHPVLGPAVGGGAELAAQVGTSSDVVTESPTGRVPLLSIPRTSSTVEVDGIPDEAAWFAMEPLPLTAFSPVYRGALTEETDIRLTHDDQYLYVSARMYDSEPEQIRTNTLYRDQYSGDDIFAVVIDSYNDYETAVWFVVNPGGVRGDRTVSNDAEFNGGMPMNSDWNSHWDVATTQTDEGWFAELRIPFSTLGFQSEGEEVTMGLIAYRFIPRKNERQVFPDIDPELGGLAFAKPSIAARMTLQGVEQSRPVYVTPYGLSGVNHAPVLNRPLGSGVEVWETERDPTYEAGLDVKFSPTSNLALDLTVNTDFAQVEADNQQVNLTRFALFFPEKRQFFQERSSTFDFRTGGFTDRLFHSRRIGLDGGQIVRIYGGGRAVGRIGGMDFGFLSMQTADQRDASGMRVRGGENMGVLRLRQQVFNPFSSVGGMLTSRLGSDGEDNLAYGLDASIRVHGDEYVSAKWAQTFDEALEEGSGLDSDLVQFRWERRRDGGFSYSGEYRRVGPDYLPRLGFQLRRDFSFYSANLQYKRFLDAESRFRSVSLGGWTNHFYRNANGLAESRTVRPELRLELKSSASLQISGSAQFESVPTAFGIADVMVPEGDYWFHQGEARLELPRSGLFRGNFQTTIGSFYDGTLAGFALNPSWTASKHIEVGGGYELNHIDFGDRDQSTTAHLIRAKIDVAFDTRVSVSTLAQYNGVDDLTAFNVRFRYHFREGTDLWVVYNEGLNTVRENALGPRLPLSAGRNLSIKYSHALIF